LVTERKRRQRIFDHADPDFPHGSYSGWKWGCRCAECVESYRGWHREWATAHRQKHPELLAKDREYKIGYRRTPEGKAVYAKANNKRHVAKKVTDHKELIKAIYAVCPVGYQVDHIVPLSKGGLHHPGNMRYLPALLNKKKQSKIKFDCGGADLDWRNFVTGTFNDHPREGSTAKRPERAETREGQNMVYSASRDAAPSDGLGF
jgi:hypothetical protein